MKKLIISTATLAFIGVISISASAKKTNLSSDVNAMVQDTVDTSTNAVSGSNKGALQKDTSSMRLPTARPGTNPTQSSTPTPTPNPSPTPAPSPTPNPSPNPTPSSSPSPTPSPNSGTTSPSNPSSPRP